MIYAEKKELFEQFIQKVNATDVDIIEVLNSTRAEAKDEFLTNPKLIHPQNARDNLSRETVERNLETIEALRQELVSSELDSAQKRLALMSLDFNFRKNDFLMAIILYNEEHSLANLMHYHNANKALYGEPDYDTFLNLLNDELDKIAARELKGEEQEMCAELYAMLGKVEEAKAPIYRPSDETVTRFSEMAEIYFEPIFKFIPEGQKTFTVPEATEIAARIMADTIDEDSEWKVEYEAERTSANVSQHSKLISFPGKRAAGDYTLKSLKKILVHEFGTHALRGIPFERSSVEMLRTGMPDYEEFEEGVAKVMESSVDGKYEGAKPRHYISIGLANFMNKNFRETFEIQRRLAQLASGKNQDSVCFNSVQRAFRGTDELPNNKDLVYFNGSAKVWQYIERNLDDPDLFEHLFLSGKSDMTNAKHRSAIYDAKVLGL